MAWALNAQGRTVAAPGVGCGVGCSNRNMLDGLQAIKASHKQSVPF